MQIDCTILVYLCTEMMTYIANLYKKSELYASFIKKLRPQPYIAFRLFMLYAFFSVTLERSFLQ